MRKLTVKEFLISEYNEHIVLYVKNLVEATYTGGRDPNEVVVTLVQQNPDPKFPGIERKIKAKEAQMNARNKMDLQNSILKVIERLIEEEDKKETKFQ